ncbi:hypothetical protein FE257_005658 [Aspergillus nanangensis]|uniref:BTB domain-containing protein n=1 Tax=Aspergillus nanangensis TaxID=2582783 RepID=A0AAD4GNU8_ASPNN|nr:hypothetical protein FE257_005658 [Aspergillus nanangensis]
MGFSDLETVMKRLLDDGKYTDMTISCQGHDFNVHRAIVCSQSHFFDAALKGGFQVSRFFLSSHRVSDSQGQEADSSQVKLPFDHVDVIALVVEYCYFQDYGREDDSLKLESDETAYTHLRVYIAADKFGIFPLCDLAATRIIAWIDSNWRSKSFLGVAQRIWNKCPSHENKLREAIIKKVSTNIQHFLAQGKGNIGLFGNPTFLLAILKGVATENHNLTEANSMLAQQNKVRKGIGLR